MKETIFLRRLQPLEVSNSTTRLFLRRAIKFCRNVSSAGRSLWNFNYSSIDVTAGFLQPLALQLHAFQSPPPFLPFWHPKIIGCNRRLRDERDVPARWKASYCLRRLFNCALEGPKGWRVASPNILLAGYAVHRLLFHNCGYFDGKVPLDQRYSIPRWLSYLHPPFRFRPPFFLVSPTGAVVFAVYSDVRSLFLSLLNE